MLDSYIGDELLVETNHEVLRHLENCAACRGELAARRDLREQIRRAVKNAPAMRINPVFVSKFQTNLRETALHPTVWGKINRAGFFNLKLLTAAVCLLVLSLFGWIWLKNSSPDRVIIAESNKSDEKIEAPRPAESPIVKAVEAAWRELAQTAVGDHKNCAVKFNLPKKPISLDEAAKKFGRFNKDLDKAVIASLHSAAPTQKLPDKIEFLDAHSCVFQGRRFAHVILKYRNQIVSILVTDTDLPPDGKTITNQSNEEMSIAGFNVARHAVFVVSKLSDAENVMIAQTISPAVRRHIEQAEV